ncbi:hypothetical protein ACFLQ6_03145 [Thermoproteota archaeon]
MNGKHQRFKIPLASISIVVFLLVCSLFVQDMKVVLGNDSYTVTFDIDPDHTGTIRFDGTWYLEGNTVVKSSGTYGIFGGPAAPNNFVRWETSGGISVGDIYSASSTATVSGTGTLRMVTHQNVVTFDIDPDHTGTIQFDGTWHLEGEKIGIGTGTYGIFGGPAAPNNFVRWETSGGISVGDIYSASSTATVSGTGTLRMITQLPQEPSTLSPVGGMTINVNKFTVVVPYIAIAGIAVAMIAFIRRYRLD